ncbi:2-dehydropantoate 2-reductase [Cyanobacterium stanieri LEGE 03274]|uniref:2-dehydropantoate 2-reductase n=1 Tax=Cyanobacterium stanieri LEGE 03274 TaxID=1828756 RepID=A0ABR9V311_9CHRO|nr:2-dehydropantoate 2-reductase [Cyanobacterium stanieri LEGE 03274]
MPIPSYPKQYRAIGIIRGKYTPLEGKLTKGIMETREGQKCDTVILSRAISAIKNHVDVNKIQNWIVYPHKVRNGDQLYLQIVGICPDESHNIISEKGFKKDYFSIRGEVLYFNRKNEKVIVKIRFNRRIKGKKSRFFKLELKGIINNNSIHHFYDFDVVLNDSKLVIQQYIDLGLIAVNI